MNNLFHGKGVWHFGAGRFFTAAALLTLFVSCNHNTPVQIFGQAQGTYYSIQYRDRQHRNLQPQIDSLLDAFDQEVSLWVDSSLLRRVNSNETTTITPLFADILSKSLQIHDYTDGAFDCRIGRLVQAWGFSFKQRCEPDSVEMATLLQAARAAVTLDTVDGQLILRKENPATELDFNAIAQGYASDLVGKMLERYGIHDYLVDIGGEVVAHGEKAPNTPWRVGIEKPAASDTSAPVVMTAITLGNASVVTSGSYRKYYERDGVRYSHTIDPATGYPVGHTLLSVSVIEDESWLADAMATAYMVMGLDKARAFIDAHPDGPGTRAVLFIYDDHGTLKIYATEEFNKLEINP